MISFTEQEDSPTGLNPPAALRERGTVAIMSANLVDEEQGLVSRELFFNEELFHLENERIFNRVWLYVAHESEIASPGDFVARSLAGEPVIVVRDDDGSVKVLLNSCRHRGVRVCRTDAGSARRFVCPYHGWTYERGGKLLSTSFDRDFPEGTDFSTMGLVEAPRVDTYRGLIFASWNGNVVDLDTYLGDFRFYVDMFFARTPGGMEVLGPPQRSRVKTNWKTAALNFGTDNQHVMATHRGPMFVRAKARPQLSPNAASKAAALGLQIATKEGHNIDLVRAANDTPFAAYNPELVPFYEQALSEQQRTALQNCDVAVSTLFPNFSFIEQNLFSEQYPAGKTLVVRQWQPISAGEIEIYSWVLAEREASPAYKEESLKNGIRVFGISGIFEQDDVELWSGIGVASRGRNARLYPFNFQTALPSLNTPMEDFPGPGEAYLPFTSEITQFKWLLHWKKMMVAGDE